MIHSRNLKRTTTCERTCNVQVSYQRIFLMKPPDSSLLRFGEWFLSMSSRCGGWLWTEGWHLNWVWKFESRFLTFRSRISTAENAKCQHEGQTILFIYTEVLAMTGPPLHVEMTYSIAPMPSILCFDLCNDPSRKAVFRDKKPKLVWPLSSLVFSALVRSCGDLWWRQFRVVEADTKCGANSIGQ